MQPKTVKTRLTKDSAKVETILTVDFSGVTEAEMQELATATAIINEQAVWRGQGSIPTGAVTLKVREQLDRPRGAGGFKVTPENTAARIAKMSREDFRSTLEAIGGLSEKQIDQLINKKFAE